MIENHHPKTNHTGARKKERFSGQEENEKKKVGTRQNDKGEGDAKEGWAWKRKTDKAKKMEVLREIDQLEKKITNLDREKSTHLYNKRSDFRKEFCVLEEQELKLLTERKQEKTKVKQQLSKMHSNVHRFQRELQNVKPTPEFVEKLKEVMEDIESQLNEFKTQQRQIYEELMKEEHILNQEINTLEKRFESWAQAPPITLETKASKPKPVSSARSVMTDLPPDVAAFERFVQQTGGPRGGWDEYDHGTFLRIRNKHKGKATFIDEAASSIPGRTITDVNAHEAWYQEYTSLQERKKDAIMKWRAVKEVEKGTTLEKAEEDAEEAAKMREQKAQAKARKLEQEKHERYQRLSAWKVQKELERAQEEERKEREEARRAREHEKEMQRKMEVKSKAMEYARLRKEEQEFLQVEDVARQETELEEKKQARKQEVARFQERDQRRMQEKKAREQAKEDARREQAKRLERLKGKVEFRAERDPSRLYKLTEGWKERRKDDTSTGNGPVIHMPRRAVPSWRTGL